MSAIRRAGTAARARPGAIPDLAVLAGRLTQRDRQLCRLVWEHRVLTSGQCASLVFGSPITARHRLVLLAGLRVLDRFRPPWQRGQGSAPWHYVLGPAGAAVLAAEQGFTLSQLGYRPDRVLAIAHSPWLAHQVGVNGFFAALAADARGRPDAALVAWWPERRCAERWGQLVRPDGYGRWRHGDQRRAGRRLRDRHAGAVWLPTLAREASLRAAMGRPAVPVATAVASPGNHPAGAVWQPAGASGPRLLLRALASL